MFWSKILTKSEEKTRNQRKKNGKTQIWNVVFMLWNTVFRCVLKQNPNKNSEEKQEIQRKKKAKHQIWKVVSMLWNTVFRCVLKQNPQHFPKSNIGGTLCLTSEFGLRLVAKQGGIVARGALLLGIGLIAALKEFTLFSLRIGVELYIQPINPPRIR